MGEGEVRILALIRGGKRLASPRGNHKVLPGDTLLIEGGPAALETFFAAIGRPKREGEPDPTPFPRPTDVLAIEARTVFAAPPAAGGRQP